MPKNNLPVVILVRPQLGENIGAVARAMSNFGLAELRLAAPRDRWPNPKALEMAAGGEKIVAAAKVFPDFASAVADIQIAYATTARPRDMEKRIVAPNVAAKEIARLLTSPSPLEGEGGVGESLKEESSLKIPPLPNPPPQGGRELKVAFIFGPERTGLENEEIVHCDMLITIPTAPDNSSLNIAQSAVVVFYEWLKASAELRVLSAEKDTTQHSARSTRHLSSPAPKADWQGLFAQLEAYLDEINYYRVIDKKTVMWQNLQNMLSRGQWSEQEVRSFRGMLRSLWERRKKGE